MDNTVTQQARSDAGQPADCFFETEHLKTDLKGRSVRGGAQTITAQAILFSL